MKYITDHPKALALIPALEQIIGYGYNLNQSFETMPEEQFRKLQREIYSKERVAWGLQYRDAACDVFHMSASMFYEVLGVMVMSNGGDITPFKDQLISAICDDEEGDAERQSYLRYYLRQIREYHGEPVIFDEFVDSAFAALI